MSASWDEGRVVPLTRHQDTAAASAPARLPRPGGPDGPLHRIRSWPAARSGRPSHGVARSAPRGSATHHTSFSVRNKNEYEGLPPLADREPRRQAVPGRGLDPDDWAQGPGRLASVRRYELLVCACALLCGALAYAAESQRLVRYTAPRVAGS